MQAFRPAKTVQREMRPWYVRTEESTQGHALAEMLSYLAVKLLREDWKGLDMTVEERLQASFEGTLSGSNP